MTILARNGSVLKITRAPGQRLYSTCNNIKIDFMFQSKNKLSLRNLSMVLRQLNVDPGERVKTVEESVEKAKEAVQLDISDGMSWCKYFLHHRQSLNFDSVMLEEM